MIRNSKKHGSFPIRMCSENFLLIVLFPLLLLEMIFFFPLVKTEGDLVSLIQNGSPKEKILAIQILSNRGETWKINEEVLHYLLNSSSSLLREFAMSPTFTRFLGNHQQAAYLRKLDRPKEKIRCSFFLDFQVGTGIPMKIDDLVAYLENLEEERISR